MAFNDNIRRVLAAQAADQRQYFADQNRANMARSFNPGIQDLLNPISSPIDGRVAQRPMRAVVRLDLVALNQPTPEPAPRVVSDHAPATPVCEPAPDSLHPPVSYTAADFGGLPDDQKILVMRQAMLYPGAAEHMKARNLPLKAAFAAELDYQASIQRGLARNVSDGKTTRYSRTQSKIDRSAGQRGLKPAGTASFRRGIVKRVTTIVPQTFPQKVEASCEIKKLGRGATGLLALNARTAQE